MASKADPTNSLIFYKLTIRDPTVKPDQIWDAVSASEYRVKWDIRMNDAKVVDKKGKAAVLYFKGRQPPVPFVYQREILLGQFEKTQEGKRVLYSSSCHHPEVPLPDDGTNIIRANVFVKAITVEEDENGGTLFSELVVLDLGGAIPAFII